MKMKIKEVEANRHINDLIELSALWEAENNCRGYVKNGADEFEGKRVFMSFYGKKVTGYLFGGGEKAKRSSSVMPDGTEYFEVDEIYVLPEYRGKGIGKKLFEYAENALKDEYGFIMLSTAAKDYKKILHFYIDLLGMDFWSARLFKKTGG